MLIKLCIYFSFDKLLLNQEAEVSQRAKEVLGKVATVVENLTLGVWLVTLTVDHIMVSFN